VAWMGLIFYLSAQSTLPNLTPGAPEVESIAGHLSVFGVLAALWWWALRSAGVRRPAAWAFIIAVVYGMSDEFHQRYVPGRMADLFDLSLDAIGAAAVLLFLIGREQHSRSRAALRGSRRSEAEGWH